MSMSDWAKKEVELAKIIEAKDLKEGEFDYGGACYDSALKAFKSLTEDNHSGTSIKITQHSPANERTKVCCEQFLYSPDGGDFDSVAILYVDDPDNKRINVSRYFKEEDNKWVEIEFTEHINRFQAYLTREGRVKSYNIK